MVKRLACSAIALALAGCMAVDIPEDAFFYPDTRMRAENIVLPADIGMMFEAETLAIPLDGPAEHGRTVGATRVRTGRPDAPLILFCGGNMFRRSAGEAVTAEKLAPFGDVLMFDYPGYGDTPGTADYAAFNAAAQAVGRTARAQAGAENRRLFAWGHSLGGPVCASIAKDIGAEALVLETTTPSARAAVNNKVGLLRAFIRIQIAPNLDAVNIPQSLNGYPGRVVVLEGGRDTVLPPALSRRLTQDLEAEGVNVTHLAFAAAGHNDVGHQADFQSRVAAALPAAAPLP